MTIEDDVKEIKATLALKAKDDEEKEESKERSIETGFTIFLFITGVAALIMVVFTMAFIPYKVVTGVTFIVSLIFIITSLIYNKLESVMQQLIDFEKRLEEKKP